MRDMIAGIVKKNIDCRMRRRQPLSSRARYHSSGRHMFSASPKLLLAPIMESPGPSKYFANLALRAARRWKFKPPQKDDKDIASEWILNFGFRNTSTTVSPVEVAP